MCTGIANMAGKTEEAKTSVEAGMVELAVHLHHRCLNEAGIHQYTIYTISADGMLQVKIPFSPMAI